MRLITFPGTGNDELIRLNLPAPAIRRIPSYGETGELCEQFDHPCRCYGRLPGHLC